ncbi:TTC1 (predicted) [Pycnogonum litorale]
MESKSDSIPSNEEIVSEITRDLEKDLEIDSESLSRAESIDDTEVCSGSSERETCTDDADAKNCKDDDIEDDDVFRLEMEEKLTEEEKEERRIESHALKSSGNDLYNEKKYEEAVKKYTQALLLCPLSYLKERSIMYSNRAACKINLDQQESAITDCTQAVKLNTNYTKAFLRRAQLYEQTDKLDDALTDYKKIVELEPSNSQANSACLRLPPLINERNEKLKQEMIGKLKDLGNMVLRPFGLSTENFKLNQDPNTGSYSVNFQNNGK